MKSVCLVCGGGKLEELQSATNDAVGIHHKSVALEQRAGLSQGRADHCLHINREPTAFLRHVSQLRRPIVTI